MAENHNNRTTRSHRSDGRSGSVSVHRNSERNSGRKGTGSSSASHRIHAVNTSYRSGGARQKETKTEYRTPVSYVLAFILSVFMLLATICFVALTSLFSETFFYSVIEDSYYEAVLSQIVTKAEDYTLPTGFDISVVDGVFTLNDVKRDVNGHVAAAFRGYSYTPDLSEVNTRLYANVTAYLAANDVPIEGNDEEVIAAYIKDIDNIFLNQVRLPGIDLIKVARAKIRNILTFALIALFAFSLVLVVVLLRLYRYPHRGLRYVTYAAGGSTLMCFALPFGLYLSKVYAHVQASPEYFYNFVTSYLKHILFCFMQAALIWLIVTIACVVVIKLSKEGYFDGKLQKKIMKKLKSVR